MHKSRPGQQVRRSPFVRFDVPCCSLPSSPPPSSSPLPSPSPAPSLHYFLTFNELSCHRAPECQEVMRADGWTIGWCWWCWRGWEGGGGGGEGAGGSSWCNHVRSKGRERQQAELYTRELAPSRRRRSSTVITFKLQKLRNINKRLWQFSFARGWTACFQMEMKVRFFYLYVYRYIYIYNFFFYCCYCPA